MVPPRAPSFLTALIAPGLPPGEARLRPRTALRRTERISALAERERLPRRDRRPRHGAAARRLRGEDRHTRAPAGAPALADRQYSRRDAHNDQAIHIRP